MAPKAKRISRPTTVRTQRPHRAHSPTTSSMIVDIPSDREEDSVAESMLSKRRRGGQEAAAQKLQKNLRKIRMVVKMQTTKAHGIVGTKKPVGKPIGMSQMDAFMTRFPYKSCQRSMTEELRRKRSLSQQTITRNEYLHAVHTMLILIRYWC